MTLFLIACDNCRSMTATGSVSLRIIEGFMDGWMELMFVFLEIVCRGKEGRKEHTSGVSNLVGVGFSWP